VKRGLQVGLLLAAWAFALPTLAETLRGVVIVVIDGDTVLFKPDHALVLNQPVEINTVATDAYGRRIAHLQKGALRINTEMVRLGLAWSSSRYQRNAEGVTAQDEARRALRGLWLDAAPTPPWVWRRAQRASD